MNLPELFGEVFPSSLDHWGISDEFIESHSRLLDVADRVSLELSLPAYMSWCVRNRDRYNQLMTDHTIDALAEIGRAGAGSALAEIRTQINAAQKDAIIAFLDGCGTTLHANDKEQIARAARRWRNDS